MNRDQGDAAVRKLLLRFGRGCDRIGLALPDKGALLGVDRQTLSNWKRPDRRPPSHYHVVVNATTATALLEAVTPDDAALFRTSKKARDQFFARLLRHVHK